MGITGRTVRHLAAAHWLMEKAPEQTIPAPVQFINAPSPR